MKGAIRENLWRQKGQRAGHNRKRHREGAENECSSTKASHEELLGKPKEKRD